MQVCASWSGLLDRRFPELPIMAVESRFRYGRMPPGKKSYSHWKFSVPNFLRKKDTAQKGGWEKREGARPAQARARSMY